jgi:hypothetical protein
MKTSSEIVKEIERMIKKNNKIDSFIKLGPMIQNQALKQLLSWITKKEAENKLESSESK